MAAGDEGSNVALDATHFFVIALEEALKDGEVSVKERAFLERVQSDLELQSETCATLEQQMRERFERGKLGNPRPFSKSRFYEKVLVLAMADGVVSEDEKSLVKYAGRLLEIGPDDHRKLLARVKARERARREAEKMGAPPPMESADELPVMEEPELAPEPPVAAIPEPPSLPSRARREPHVSRPTSLPPPPIERQPARTNSMSPPVLAGIAVCVLVPALGLLYWNAQPASQPAKPSVAENAPARPAAHPTLPAPPAPPKPASAASDIFSASPDDQIGMLVEEARKPLGLVELKREAERKHKVPELLELFVRALPLKDKRMLESASDTQTSFGPGGKIEEKTVNERVDDSLFKETLLYAIRDNVPRESPLIDKIFEAYKSEEYPMTRMRIVRAIGKIGGKLALARLLDIQKIEGRSFSYAAQEAQKQLSRAGY